MNIPEDWDNDVKPDSLTLADKWILGSLQCTVNEVQKSLSSYRFNDAASHLYDFIWHKYCDWYLELSKLTTDKFAAQHTLLKVLDGILRLLHPFMPFITEELWHMLPGRKEEDSLMLAEWPVFEDNLIDEGSLRDMETLIDLITAIRT